MRTKDFELLRNGSVYEFYRLKGLITLDQVNTSVVENFVVGCCKLHEVFKSCVLTELHGMQMSLVMSMR